MLGHILGSKDASRQLASEAAARTGLDVGILKKMLPAIAAMLMGGLSKQEFCSNPSRGLDRKSLSDRY